MVAHASLNRSDALLWRDAPPVGVRALNACLACMLLVLALPALAQGLVVSGSSYVQADQPTSNFGAGLTIILKNNVANNVNVRLGYLQFDLAAVGTDFPADYGLNMVVTGNNQGTLPTPPQSFAGATTADPGTFNIQVWGLNANTAWSQGMLTWNNAPGAPALINSALQARYGFNESQASLLATCSVAANTPPATFHCASTALLDFMNARKGQASVTLMFRRSDTNSQANLSFASSRYVPAVGSAGDYSPTFASPGAVGPLFSAGPVGTFVGNTPTVSTNTPTSAWNGSLIEATVGGSVTDTGGDSPTQFVQYRLASGGPWVSVAMGLSVGTATSSGGAYGRTLTVLSPNTHYEVQAYATNAGGTAYGAIVPFTTATAPASAPVPIPSSSLWSSMALVLLTALAGLTRLRRRPAAN